VTAKVLINGRSTHVVDSSDRGFQYGDGVFTTLPVRDGHPVFLDLHLQRLSRDCHRLGIPYPGGALIADEARGLCRQESSGVLKIQITRGAGDRGYRPPDKPEPTRVIRFKDTSERAPLASLERGAAVRLCAHRLGRNPALAGMKHMNRLDQIMARSEWCSDSVHEGLMTDMEGLLIEGTMSNVFLVLGNHLVTPDLSQCGVAGVMRSVILTIAGEAQIPTEIRTVTCDELRAADEVFLTNSVIGLCPVVAMADRRWPVGPITRLLCHRVAQRILADIGLKP
jgi:4-amino-4-deoxychorismate lyase